MSFSHVFLVDGEDKAPPPSNPIRQSDGGAEIFDLQLKLSVGRRLRPAGRRVLKVLLPSIRCRVEESVGVRERFGAARIRRVSVENVVVGATGWPFAAAISALFR